MVKLQRSSARAWGYFFLVAFTAIFALVASGVLQPLDVKAFILVNERWNVPALNAFFIYASRYGRSYFWIPVVFFAWVLGGDKYKRGALMMAIAFLIIITVGLTLKAVYFRPRPFLVISTARVLMARPSDSSFPSGHSLIVFGGATIALLFSKRRYSVPLLGEAILVSYSRVYVGLHYPSDVVAGALLGSSIALLVYGFGNNVSWFEDLYRVVSSVYYGLLSFFS